MKKIDNKKIMRVLNSDSSKMHIKVYFIALIVLLIDCISKLLVLKSGNVLSNRVVIPGFFYIHYSTNTGGAFSLFSSLTWLIILLSFLVLIYIDRKLIKSDISKLQMIALSFLIGGITGNLIDRIVRGEVVDFLSFIISGYSFPIFNFADVFICLGSILLIFDIIRGEVYEYKSRK